MLTYFKYFKKDIHGIKISSKELDARSSAKTNSSNWRHTNWVGMIILVFLGEGLSLRMLRYWINNFNELFMDSKKHNSEVHANCDVLSTLPDIIVAIIGQHFFNTYSSL